EDRRAELDPGAMLGASQGINRMQRMRPRLLEIFQDHGALEDGAVVDLEDRRLAERRKVEEPRRLGGKVDIDAVERHRLLDQRDGGPLHVGTEGMADQGAGPWAPSKGCRCISIDSVAYNVKEL